MFGPSIKEREEAFTDEWWYELEQLERPYAEVLAERDERERQERQKKEQEIFKRQAQNRAEARRKRLEQEALENDEDFD